MPASESCSLGGVRSASGGEHFLGWVLRGAPVLRGRGGRTGVRRLRLTACRNQAGASSGRADGSSPRPPRARRLRWALDRRSPPTQRLCVAPVSAKPRYAASVVGTFTGEASLRSVCVWPLHRWSPPTQRLCVAPVPAKPPSAARVCGTCTAVSPTTWGREVVLQPVPPMPPGLHLIYHFRSTSHE